MAAQGVLESAKRRTAVRIRSLLLRHCPHLATTTINVEFQRNRRTMISWSRRGGEGTLRLHQIFADAADPILESVVRHFFTPLSRSERRSLRARITDFVARNRSATLSETHFPRIRPPQGRVYDLDRVRGRVTHLYVPEYRSRQRRLRIGWSFRRTPTLMGKWIEGPPGRPNLIVINRLLDSERVPSFYVEYIVYHEILHDLFPIRRRGGRWVHHSAEFRRRERDFPRYREARRWEEEGLPSLLCHCDHR